MSARGKAALLALIGLLAGSAVVLESRDTQADSNTAREHSMQRTELFFGAIEEAQWEQFLEQEVTPRFPDGLSWYDVHGQWRGLSGKPEKLPSRIVLLIHADNPANRQNLTVIGQRFKQRFGMAVLQVTGPVTASDPDWTDARVEGNQQLAPQP